MSMKRESRMSPVKIGLVDNDFMTLLALKAIIMKCFAEEAAKITWSERRGEIALDKCLDSITRPDVLFVDMDMDDIDGAELCTRVRRYSSCIVLYGMTAHSLHEYEGQAMRCGMQALLDKASIGSLRKVISGLIDDDVYIQEGFRSPGKAFQDLKRNVCPKESLSPREIEVLDLTIDGHTAHEVAEIMGLADSTVKTHIRKSIQKLGVRNKLQLIRTWSRRRLNL